jgi:flagellar biosynthesis protein FlhB
MSDSGGDKKHFATERRREKAREEGQIVRSQDLSSAAMLLAALGVLYAFGGDAAEVLAQTLSEALSSPTLMSTDTGSASNYLLRTTARLAVAIVPIMLSMMVAGIMVNVTQTGIILSPERLMPNLSHISLLSGAKRILSLQGVARLGFGLFKLLIIGAVSYMALMKYRQPILNMPAMSVPQIARVLFESLLGTGLWIGIALFVLAILEYGFQKWKFEQDLMMTDQEIRDEMKESEGDPQIKSRRRQAQRAMMMARMNTEVPKADVVVTNPTELAIAIQYDPVTMPAPIVLAKGAGVLAQRIRRIALENGIPVVERKPLAQILYKTVDVGGIIPTDQYTAVAEVLRYVYQLQGKKIPTAA